MQIGRNARLLVSPERAYRNAGKRLKRFINLLQGTDVPYGRTIVIWISYTVAGVRLPLKVGPDYNSYY